MRLGHIVYSNCFPVHSRLIDQPRRGDPAIIAGVPSQLNAMLLEGGVDVAPCSSIEYALHPDRYRVLPDLVIGSRGAVGSIILVADRPPEDLGGMVVGIPTASATSVVLLKILLRHRWNAEVAFHWFDQRTEDPIAMGAAAALFIGDVALRADLHPELPVRLDLGAEWWGHTSLPFAFAVWQAGGGSPSELRDLHGLLVESREYGLMRSAYLAHRYGDHFGMEPGALADYWDALSFRLDPEMKQGLQRFYELAADIGELTGKPIIQWVA
jgi:chorismate dehydratase